MDLQNTFYILGIIIMTLIFIILITIVVAIFAIRAKVNAIHKTIEEKLNMVNSLASTGATIFKKAKEAVDKHS
jgi:uncharacterized membrane protein